MAVSRDELLRAGWTIAEIGGFTAHAGPVWRRVDDTGPRFGVLIEGQHLNLNDVAHGGLVGFFADVALGLTVIAKLDGRPAATIQLNIHYIGAAGLGDFIEARVEVVRITRSVVFVRGTLISDDKTVATADGVWKILET